MDSALLSGNVNLLLYRLICILVCILVQSCARERIVNVEVINQTPNQLSNIVVKVYNERYEAEKLSAGEKFNFSFLPKWETEYAISWRTADGREIHQNVGYISSGLNENDYLKIHDSRVIFESK